MKFNHVLVLYKSTICERLIQEKIAVRHGIPRRFKQAHHDHYATLNYVTNMLTAKGIPFKAFARGAKGLRYEMFDFIITVGGDGTFLEAAKNAGRQLILGVNSAPRWSVGRFCSATQETFSAIFERLVNRAIPVRQLRRMQLRMRNAGRRIEALNDVLICHQNPAAMSHYFIKVGKIKEEHRSSGIWIATAAGSTGAIHSAGGEVQHVSDQRLQYRTRELYIDCGIHHGLKSGFITPGHSVFVESLMPEGVIYVDGSHEKVAFPFGEKVLMSIAPRVLRVVGL